MFVRFRKSVRRLDVSLVESSRTDGGVRQAHIASLGSIPLPLDTASRVTFWAQLHARLARLANRIGADDSAKIMAAAHARIPMPTAEEQRALQLENIKAEAGFWGSLEELHAGDIECEKALAACVNAKIAEAETERAKAADNAAAAKERLAKIERGEDVAGGLGKPIGSKDWERHLGKSSVRRGLQLAELEEAAFQEFLDETMKQHAVGERKALRTVRKRYGGSGSRKR
jgi:hypothetical protein